MRHKTSTPQTQRVLQAAPFGPPNEPPPAPSRRQPPPPNSGVAHRGRLLKADADAAARSVFERLFGLVSNPVASEPGSEGQDGNGESKRVSMGADTKANTSGTGAHLSSVIFVSLRMAPSAETPSAPMPLPQRLRGRGMGNGERVGVSMGADTRAKTSSGAAAHSRVVIFVSLRTAASAMTPSAPMLFSRRLRARGRMETVRKYTSRCANGR